MPETPQLRTSAGPHPVGLPGGQAYAHEELRLLSSNSIWFDKADRAARGSVVDVCFECCSGGGCRGAETIFDVSRGIDRTTNCRDFGLPLGVDQRNSGTRLIGQTSSTRQHFRRRFWKFIDLKNHCFVT